MNEKQARTHSCTQALPLCVDVYICKCVCVFSKSYAFAKKNMGSRIVYSKSEGESEGGAQLIRHRFAWCISFRSLPKKAVLRVCVCASMCLTSMSVSDFFENPYSFSPKYIAFRKYTHRHTYTYIYISMRTYAQNGSYSSLVYVFLVYVSFCIFGIFSRRALVVVAFLGIQFHFGFSPVRVRKAQVYSYHQLRN